jgi:hypothetical protein
MAALSDRMAMVRAQGRLNSAAHAVVSTTMCEITTKRR